MSGDWGPCRSCHAGVRWAKSAKTDKPMPLQRDSEHGNVVIDSYGRAHVFRSHGAAFAATQTVDVMLGAELWLSHHANCPSGRAWQGRRRVTQDQGSLL